MITYKYMFPFKKERNQKLSGSLRAFDVHSLKVAQSNIEDCVICKQVSITVLRQINHCCLFVFLADIRIHYRNALEENFCLNVSMVIKHSLPISLKTVQQRY